MLVGWFAKDLTHYSVPFSTFASPRPGTISSPVGYTYCPQFAIPVSNRTNYFSTKLHEKLGLPTLTASHNLVLESDLRSLAKMLQTLVIVLICIVAVIVMIGLAALINTATKKTGPNIPV
ncbi:hypothetical protein EAF00_009032 [Botryotinia globosa]|nr:hypothetical protein EAF00_009032 [Botryotinia globosa]